MKTVLPTMLCPELHANQLTKRNDYSVCRVNTRQETFCLHGFFIKKEATVYSEGFTPKKQIFWVRDH